MTRRFALLSALPLLLVSSHAAASEWHRVTDDAAPAAPTASKAAHLYLAGHGDALRLQAVDLRAVAELSVGKHRVVRYRQHHHGLPVIGAAAAVRVRPDQRTELVVLDVERGLTVSPLPTWTAAAAREVVAARRGAPGGGQWAATLAVLPSLRGGQLVWQIDVPGSDGGRRYLVDAHDGTLRGERPLAIHALGRVYPISSVATPTPEDRELLDLVASTPQHLNGWSGQLTVTNYVSGDSMNGYEVAQALEPSAGEDFLYDPPVDGTDATDPFAQVGIYYHLTRMRDFYANTLGLDMTAPSWKLTAVANAMEGASPMDNAFFSEAGITGAYASPNLIAIGQGSTLDFADDSDVFLHEFTHYVTNNAIGYNLGQAYANEYGLSPFGGSIDEGVSDYFACTENDDPYLGEATLGLLGAGRDLADTSKKCPDDVMGEVHADGEMVGSFSWTLRVLFGKAIGDQLIWGALTLLTPDTTLGDFAAAVRETAVALVADGTLTNTDLDAIDAAITERGLDDCGNVIPLTKDASRGMNLFGLDVVAQFFGGSCQDLKGYGLTLQSLFHYRITPEAGDELVRIAATMSPGSGAIDWGIYVRAGQHVTFDTSGFMPALQDYDYAVEHLTAQEGELVIDATSTPPFDPSVDYYAVLVHQNCPAAYAVLSTNADLPQGTGGAGGAGGSDSGGGGPSPTGGGSAEDDGCGCRTAGAPSSSWGGVALLAAALGLARRRRR